MDSVIYSPLTDYESRLRQLHLDKTTAFFDDLVKRSGIDIEENRKTVKKHDELRENLKKLNRKRNWMRFFRVLMCITVILIPIVIWKMTPKIRALKTEIDDADKLADELFALAQRQMIPLNRLFTDRDGLDLIEQVMPLAKFDGKLSVEQELDMRVNFDFDENFIDESTLDVLAGRYNGNPFLFENRFIHRMGTETYHGTKTIRWTESYVDSEGNRRTRSRSETLHAYLTKPKPFYHTRVVLVYGAQGGPELRFSREATYINQRSDKAVERHIKKGEKKLKRKTDKAIKSNDDFMSMSNSEFEVLFNALNRTDEVQFRTLFTPLAQNNMVDLILSDSGYGDDFAFVKNLRMNKIVSNHSQGRQMIIRPDSYISHSYDIIRNNFINGNAEFFKAVYFDFAPILAIPMYQERPVHSLKPIPDYTQMYSVRESEALANIVDKRYFVHPDTKTDAIIKTECVASSGNTDEVNVTAYSYDSIPRVDYVSVYGGDGRYHDVPVHWDEYIPLEQSGRFFITEHGSEQKKSIASRNGLCIFN